jgi:hypothetical protein
VVSEEAEVKSDLGAIVLSRRGFFGDAVPEGIGFCKSGFDGPGRE